jgi:hypothetical protein
LIASGAGRIARKNRFNVRFPPDVEGVVRVEPDKDARKPIVQNCQPMSGM